MSWLSNWIDRIGGRIRDLWLSVKPAIKEDVQKAAAELGNVALDLVLQQAGKVIAGEVKLNNVAVGLLPAAKEKGMTISLDLARTIAQDVYTTFRATDPTATPLIAGENDSAELHAAIEEANAAQIQLLHVAGRVQIIEPFVPKGAANLGG